VLYSGFTVVILAPVNIITKSVSLLCVYLRKLQKSTPGHCIWNAVFHPGVSWFSSQGKRAHVSLHWNTNHVAVKGFRGFGYLLVAFISSESYSLCLWVRTCCRRYYGSVLRGKWRAWWRESISHFLPSKIRVRSQRQIHFLTARVPNVSLQTLGSSRP